MIGPSGGAVFDGDGAVLLPDGAVFSVREQHRASVGERRAMHRAVVLAAWSLGASRAVMARVRWKAAVMVVRPSCQAAYYGRDDAPTEQAP